MSSEIDDNRLQYYEQMVVRAERARIADIFALGSYLGQESSGRHLALKTDVSPEVAEGILLIIADEARAAAKARR